MKRNLPIVIVFMLLAGCAAWPLGEDPKGKEYRAQANVLIEALVQYQKENGELPQKLEILVPQYIQKLPEVAKLSFYSKEKESLVYNYSPSWPQLGQTSCSTVIGSGKWGCHGYI